MKLPKSVYEEVLLPYSEQKYGYIIDNVLEYLGIGREIINNSSRAPKYSFSRQICHYFLRSRSDLSYSMIGMMVGGKDHSTVIHSIKNVKILITPIRVGKKVIIPNVELKEIIDGIDKILTEKANKH